jgi:glycosyltransferase involved in cell wall biosynthesis
MIGMNKQPISVCYIKNHMGSGGSTDLFLEICNHADSNYEFSAYGIEGGDKSAIQELRRQNITVKLGNAKSKLDLMSLYRMYRYLSRNEFDVIHAHLPYAQIISRLFSCAINNTTIVSKQSSMPRNYHPVTRILERITQPLDDKTVTATKAVQNAFTGTSNFYHQNNNTKWCTIHNGINVSEFNSKVNNSNKCDITTKYNLDSGPVLLNIGRYTKAKSQKDLIPVMNKVTDRYPEATLLIVGYGELSNKLVKQIDRAGLSDNIYVTGRAESVYRYYKAADIFVLSSRTEGFGIVNLEAMCAKLPIVATDIPAVREIVQHNKTGELVPIGNYEQMANSIIKILSDKDIMKKYSEHGFTRAKEKFDVSFMAEQYLSIYDDLSNHVR